MNGIISEESAAIFVTTVVAVAVLGVLACGQLAENRARGIAYGSVLISLWLAVTYALARSGALSDFASLPPRFLIFLVACFALTTWLACSRLGDRFLELPPVWLVGFQAFRVPVEWFLHRIYREGVIPVQMTFEGWNFDILAGASAIVVAWLCARSETIPVRAVLLWCVVGASLLLTIVFIATTSAPSPIRLFMNEPSNTFVVTAPYIWLPAFLVQAAWFGHVLVFRLCRQTIRGRDTLPAEELTHGR